MFVWSEKFAAISMLEVQEVVVAGTESKIVEQRRNHGFGWSGA